MKNQIIYALMVLQLVSTAVWFSQVRHANRSEVSCQLTRISESTAMYRALNELNAEYQTIKKMEQKTKYRPKIMVNK